MAGNRRIDPRENRSYEEPLLPPLHEVLGDVLGKRIPHTEPPPQTEPPPHIKPPPHIPRHSPHDYRSEHGQNVSYRPVGIDVSTQPVQPHDRGWQRPLPSSGSIPPRPTQSSSSHPHASSSRPHASSSRSHASSSRLDASSLGPDASSLDPDASSLDPDASSSDSEPSHSYHVFNVTPDKGLVHQRSSRQDDFDGSRLRPRPSNSTDTVRKYACSECERRFAKPSTLKNHSLTHTGEKPYECTHAGCGKRFSMASNMHRHMKTHLSGSAFHEVAETSGEDKDKTLSRAQGQTISARPRH